MKNNLAHYGNTDHSPTERQRIGRFGVVGIFNTVLDFVLYNALSAVGLPLYAANICSTSFSMGVSYIANKRIVFSDRTSMTARQTVAFFVVTASGLWIIQTGIIQLLTDQILIGTLSLSFHAPILLGLYVAHRFGFGTSILPMVLTDSFMVKNGAKLFGIIFSMTWNYILYRNVVFLKKATA